MKVKNDHRSKFSNLSNTKEEAWKNQQNLNTFLKDVHKAIFHITREMAMQLKFHSLE